MWLLTKYVESAFSFPVTLLFALATTYVSMETNVAVEPEMLSDASLVEQSLAGDNDAFGRIVARYQSPICALAYSACGNVSRSEDIAQEIFITAWRKLNNLHKPPRFKAWLYGIARNLIHNAFRRQSRSPLADAELLENATEQASWTDEPDVHTISKEEESSANKNHRLRSRAGRGAQSAPQRQLSSNGCDLQTAAAGGHSASCFPGHGSGERK